MEDLDIVYVVRPGDDNEELRYSLRSLANLPHRDVWLAGHRPPWVRNVGSVETQPRPEKWANINQSLLAACQCEHISQRVIVFNDDIFVTRRIEEFPTFHLGPLAQHIERLDSRRKAASNSYHRGLLETRQQLHEWGITDPLSYEAHVPMIWDRDELARLIETSTRRPFLYATAYPASSGPVGEQGINVKVAKHDRDTLDAKLAAGLPFISSDDESFTHGAIGDYIRGMFPTPGPYEATPHPADKHPTHS